MAIIKKPIGDITIETFGKADLHALAEAHDVKVAKNASRETIYEALKEAKVEVEMEETPPAPKAEEKSSLPADDATIAPETPKIITPTAEDVAKYAPRKEWWAKKDGSAWLVIDPSGKVFRSYTKNEHENPEEAATGFATKQNNKR